MLATLTKPLLLLASIAQEDLALRNNEIVLFRQSHWPIA